MSNTKYKVWITVERIDDFGTDDEDYSETDATASVAYRDTFEEAESLMEEIVLQVGEINNQV
jgi:hypothetical protein